MKEYEEAIGERNKITESKNKEREEQERKKKLYCIANRQTSLEEFTKKEKLWSTASKEYVSRMFLLRKPN